MLKIKHVRTIDCALGGFGGTRTVLASWSARCCSASTTTGKLHHVGITSSFKMQVRRELAEELESYRAESLEGHPWNWGAGKERRGPRRRP